MIRLRRDAWQSHRPAADIIEKFLAA